MMRPAPGRRRTTDAILVYLVVLLSLQIFVVAVAVDAFTTGDHALGWTTAAISVVLASGAALLVRNLRH
jgi:hypothetical protein